LEVFAGKFFLFYKNSGIENGAWLVISGTTTAVTKDNYGATPTATAATTAATTATTSQSIFENVFVCPA